MTSDSPSLGATDAHTHRADLAPAPGAPAVPNGAEGSVALDEPTPSPWGKSVIMGLVAVGIVTLVLLAFLWPTATSEAKNLPVQVVASQEAYDQFIERTDAAAAEQGADLPFEFTRVDSRDDAIQAIKEREAYGAYVLPAAAGEKLEVLTATAANASVATMLTRIGDSMVTGGARAGIAQAQQAAASGQAPAAANPQQAAQMQQQMLAQLDSALEGPTVTDVVPLDEEDPQGAGLSVASLPLTMGGIVGGMVLANALRGTWRRVVGVLVYAAAGGLVMVLVLDTWFGFAPAPTLQLWAAISLSLAATVGLIVGLHSVLGAPGLGIGAIITMLIGNPIAAAQAPREFLPGPFGEIGQWFVPGATGTLVRDLSYFPEASTLHPWLVLAGWVALGLVLMVLGHHRTGGHGHSGGGRAARNAAAEAGARRLHHHEAAMPVTTADATA